MKDIFAPWRMAYIETTDKPQGCIFCDFPGENDDEKRLILHRGKKNFVIMNAFPYNSGHLMVVPYRHTREYSSLSDDELLEMHRLAGHCIEVMKRVLNPQGFNMGINLGRVAGAGVDGHLHLHIVPRWNGDTNFMPVFGDVRVIPEDLSVTYHKLLDAWNA